MSREQREAFFAEREIRKCCVSLLFGGERLVRLRDYARENKMSLGRAVALVIDAGLAKLGI